MIGEDRGALGLTERAPGGVMVVDDDVELLRSVTGLLNRHGMIARPMTSAERALDAALLDPPDLILLDIALPGISGFELCRELRHHEALEDVPVIFISGSVHLEDRARAFDAGGSDFLSKPLHEAEVVARVRAHLDAAQLRWLLRHQNALLEVRLAEAMRQANARRELLLGRNHAVLELHSAIESPGTELVDIALRRAVALTGARACVYAIAFNRGRFQVERIALVGPDGPVRLEAERGPLGGSAVERARVTRAPVVVAEPNGVAEAGAVVTQVVGRARRACVVPLLERNQVVSMLIAFDLPEAAEAESTNSLQILGDALWQILRRKEAEEALHKSLLELQKLALAVEQSPASVMIADRDGNIEYVNQHFTEVSGYALDEVVGKNPRVLKSGDTPPEEYAALWETITSGRTWTGIFRNVRKDGSPFWERASISPVRVTPDAPITHFVAVKEDITVQRELEAQLRQAQKLEAIGQLAAGVAHEINTPSQYVGDNLAFLRRVFELVEPVLTEALSKTESEQAEGPGRRLSSLVARLPSAFEQAKYGLERISTIVAALSRFSFKGDGLPRPVALANLFESSATLTRNTWKYVALLEQVIDPAASEVEAIESELGQVIINLMVNATHAIEARFGSSAEIPGRITLTARPMADEDAVEIVVADNGCGIPDDVAQRVYEPFFTTKAQGHGTGQGLAIALNIVVNRHGGRLWFDSVVGEGTTFHICLPCEARRTPPPL